MKRLCLLLTLAACVDTSAEEPADTATVDDALVIDGFFPLAADWQPHTDLAKWPRRGVNTVIRVPGSDSVAKWTAAARALHLKMIREPSDDPHDDRNDADLLAWHWADEPELHDVPASQLADVRAKLHAIDPDRPIAVNFWGGGMRQGTSYNGHAYRDYIAKADWISDDIYPCNNYGCDLGVVGHALDQLASWSHDGQQRFAYIETGDIDGNGSGPSPRRFRAEVWEAIEHGARGIYYFTARIAKPCSSDCLRDYDMTPPDVVDEMAHTNAQIARLAGVLQRRIDPDGGKLEVGDGLEVTWRHASSEGAYYYFVLNAHDDTKSHRDLSLAHVTTHRAIEVVDEHRTIAAHHDDATLTDDFKPYELHIYKVIAD